MTEEHKPAQHAENCHWHPDGCDCELGRLRAEVERLKEELKAHITRNYRFAVATTRGRNSPND